MSNYKYLAKNIGFLTIGNFGTKLLTFFLVPLYTNVLTTAEYGTYDMFNTTIGLIMPILTLNISESMLRFALEKDVDNKEIFSIGFSYLIKSSLLVAAALIVNRIFNLIPILNDYALCFFFMYVLNVLVTNLLCFSRGIDRVRDVSISGVVCSAVTIACNLLFLLPMHMGILGYFWATIIGLVVQTTYLFVCCRGWRYLHFGKNDLSVKKKMVKYSKPMIANSIAWWINNASDRYIVTFFCGIAVNGIYSVGYKIPSILNVFQNIFNQAWTLSAVKDFDSEDKDGFFSQMYNTYNFIMVFLCSGLILFDRFLAKFLYAKEFYVAWKYVPFLMIAIVFGSLSGYIGGIFSAVKDSGIFAKTTVVGAIVNIVLNIILIQFWGALGAAVATMISYVVVWILRLKNMRKYVKIRLYLKRDILVYVLLIVQTILVLTFTVESIKLYLAEIIIVGIILLLFKKELQIALNMLLKKIKNK